MRNTVRHPSLAARCWRVTRDNVRAEGLALAISMLGILATAAPALHAAAFPIKPIRFIATALPGGASDILARRLAQIIQNQTGAVVVVENIGGASGSIGLLTTARAQPDGYTIVIAVPDAVTIFPLTKKVPPYSVEANLTPLAQVIETNFVFAANAKNPASTLGEFVDRAKQSPKVLNFSTAGAGTTGRFVMELLMQSTGLRMEHIPYRSTAPALQSIATGETELMATSYASMKALTDAGMIKPIGVTSEVRLMNIPTAKEVGIPNMVVPVWWGVFGPKNLPPEVVSKLGELIGNAVISDDFKTQAAALGVQPKLRVGDDFRRFIEADTSMWKGVIQRSGVPLED